MAFQYRLGTDALHPTQSSSSAVDLPKIPRSAPALRVTPQVRRARFGPGLRPGPRRQARWAGRGLRGQGWALAPIARRRDRRGSALDAGGASPDTARRSGPRRCDLSSDDRHIWRVLTTGPASSRKRLTHGCVTAGCAAARCRGIGGAGSGPRPVRSRARGRGPEAAPPPAARVPSHPFRPPTLSAHFPSSFTLSVPAPRISRMAGPSARRAEGAPLKL